MLQLSISGILNISYTSIPIIKENDRKYKFIVNYYLNFSESYDDENKSPYFHKTIT